MKLPPPLPVHYYRKRYTTSGKHLTRKFPAEYAAWHAARQRCFNPSHPDYKNYGGRGIGMSLAWRDDFEQFISDMGPRLPGLTLDRINNDGDYSADNCRWATRKQQSKNRRPRVGRDKALCQNERPVPIPYLEDSADVPILAALNV